MSASRRILCILPTAFRTFNNAHILSYGNSRLSLGYVYPIFSKSLRFLSNNVSEENKRTVELEKVYYGLLTPQIKAVKIISFTTSVIGILAQPLLFKQVSSMGGGLPVIVGLCSFVGFFTFVTPLLLHYIAKKYITHLDYNPETGKYVATVLSFFCRKQQIEFSVEDVKVPDVPGMFTSFLVKGRPLFVDPTLFANPAHYGKLMGYDKPIDFKLSVSDSDKKS